MKQTIKKKDFSRPNINSIKEKLGLVTTDDDLTRTNAEKPTEFIPMPDAYVEALKLPGIPMGYLTLCTGWSNTGKSTLKNCLIASCINNGILPVIYETESNFDFQYAIDCGMKATPVYGDVEVDDVDTETGEIIGTHTEKKIKRYDGNFIFFDSKVLADMYGDNDYSTGKKTKTKRKIAVIEDIAYSMNEILDMQDAGDIQQPICFIWDSVGSIDSYRSYSSKTNNAMFNAGALSVAFNTIVNNRIPISRKISEKYTNTFFCVNKIWNDSMSSMAGVPSIELKGGKSFFFAARLVIHVGGVAKAATKKLTATSKGSNYTYGIISKIRVNKNQLPSPYNISYENEIACVHNGLASPDRLEEYKKVYMKDILKRIEDGLENGEKLNTEDVEFIEEETIDE